MYPVFGGKSPADRSLWHYTGHSKFSAGDVFHTSLAVGPAGDPYIVYQDAANNNYGTVMTFDGSSWVNLGIPGFTVDTVAWTRLRFSQVGQPYVAFNDWSNSQKVSVMMYDGPLGVKEIQKPTLSLYPDPAWDFLTIDLGIPGNNMNRMEIYNIIGSQVMTIDFSGGTAHLNIQSLAPGIYFVKVYDTRDFYTVRFTKE